MASGENARDGDLLDVINNLDGVFQNWGVGLVIGGGVFGVILAGLSFVALHSALQEQHSMATPHHHYWGYIMGAGIGSLITISSILVAWFGLLY